MASYPIRKSWFGWDAPPAAPVAAPEPPAGGEPPAADPPPAPAPPPDAPRAVKKSASK